MSPVLVLISDTHGRHRGMAVPEGDILVHAGDIGGETRQGVEDFNDWLGSLSHRRKVVVAGNHDRFVQRQEAQARALLSNALYLLDETAEIEGLLFHGSPWVPEFHPVLQWTARRARKLGLNLDAPRRRERLEALARPFAFAGPRAFNLPGGESLRRKWALAPEGLDVLVTHGPPRGILDATLSGALAGCPDLAERVRQAKPRLHVFGHIHEAYGRREIGGTLFANASAAPRANPPFVVELAPRPRRRASAQ